MGYKAPRTKQFIQIPPSLTTIIIKDTLISTYNPIFTEGLKFGEDVSSFDQWIHT